MTTETRHTSISEDWEELDAISGEDGIYDDTASILSLSTTVAESEDYDTSDGAASKDHVTDAQESSSLPIRDRAPAGTNPTQDDDADSIASADTITRDLLDVVVEPPILLSTLDSLQSTLNEIIPLCGDQNSTNGHDAVQGVSEALHRLLGTIMDLKEVVSCYVRLWNPNDPFSRTPPLDPTLYKWCSDCAIELYKLRAEFGQQAAKTAPFPNWNCYSDDLNRFCEDMSVFLPIMRVYVL
jgi:hypothetical protein